MANALGLDDDLDDVELVQSVEAAFDLRIPNEDAERMLVVGDLYDWLVANIRSNSDANKCASAMAFYRLRRGIRRLGFEQNLVPASALNFLEGPKLKATLADLQKETGLQLPKAAPTRVTFISYIVTALMLAGALTDKSFLEQNSIFVPLLTLIGLIGWQIYALDPGKLPKSCLTLGAMTKTVASRNFGRLAKMGARHGPRDIWENLLPLLSIYNLPVSEITRETYFLESQLEKRRSF